MKTKAECECLEDFYCKHHRPLLVASNNSTYRAGLLAGMEEAAKIAKKLGHSGNRKTGHCSCNFASEVEAKAQQIREGKG